MEGDRSLIERAATGDRDAAGRYFSENLGLLGGLARRIAGGVLDPEDLLSEAMVTVLGHWSTGTGPATNATAYIAVLMRNRVKDELKSPRSRVDGFEDWDELPALGTPAPARVDVHNEVRILREALDSLPADQRSVLIEMTAFGTKPRELEGTLHRPAPAISSLHRRAKIALRRAVFRVVLEEGAPESCRRAIRAIPEKFGDLPERGAIRGEDHFDDCERCTRAWRRFAGLTSAFGLLPLLVVSLRTFEAPAAAVAAEGTVAAGSTGGNSAGTSTGAALALAPGTGAASVAAPAIPASAAASARRLPRVRWSARSIIGLTLMGGAGILLGALALSAGTGSLWFAPEPRASFTATATANATEIRYAVRFGVEDQSWSNSELHLRVDSPVRGVQAPAGWICAVTETAVNCATPASGATGGNFIIHTDSAGQPVRATLDFTADLTLGRQASGTASLLTHRGSP